MLYHWISTDWFLRIFGMLTWVISGKFSLCANTSWRNCQKQRKTQVCLSAKIKVHNQSQIAWLAQEWHPSCSCFSFYQSPMDDLLQKIPKTTHFRLLAGRVEFNGNRRVTKTRGQKWLISSETCVNRPISCYKRRSILNSERPTEFASRKRRRRPTRASMASEWQWRPGSAVTMAKILRRISEKVRFF